MHEYLSAQRISHDPQENALQTLHRHIDQSPTPHINESRTPHMHELPNARASWVERGVSLVFLSRDRCVCVFSYEVGTISRLPTNIRLFCKRALHHFLPCDRCVCVFAFEVAMISMLPRNIGHLCKRALQKRSIFCKRDVYFSGAYQ